MVQSISKKLVEKIKMISLMAAGEKQLLCHYRYSLEKKKRKEVAKSSISEVRTQQFGNKLIKSHHSNLFTKSERSSHVHM